jgi:hypothetical protein
MRFMGGLLGGAAFLSFNVDIAGIGLEFSAPAKKSHGYVVIALANNGRKRTFYDSTMMRRSASRGRQMGT